MKVLFINPVPPKCGVHQYGLRLYSILVETVRMNVSYSTTDTCDSHGIPDVIVYNWHPLIDGPCEVAQRERFKSCKRVIIYHDGAVPVAADKILFSHPTVKNDGQGFHCIGRPLPEWIPTPAPAGDRLRVGIAGFCGAWAADSIYQVLTEYDAVHFRLLLPFSDWCDSGGGTARSTAAHCQSLMRPGDMMEVEHNFLTEHDMLAWLSINHVNCYIRNTSPSLGISSALDNALAVRRPIAINKNPMFRHMFGCSPSICIEDTPLRDIIRNGVDPLIPVYQRNDRRVVLEELEKVLLSL